MQNSSEFQFVATDQIHESTTVRPAVQGFEIVAGARRFRAAQIAELFSIPTRIVELDDAGAMEWQLVENSQRVDVHPYEEAQRFPTSLRNAGL